MDKNTFGYATKDGVLSVEPLSRAQRHEKLGAVSVLARIGHWNYASARVFQLICDLRRLIWKICFRNYLIVKSIAIYGRATTTCTRGITTLYHEVS